jgi:hypothetical protein
LMETTDAWSEVESAPPSCRASCDASTPIPIPPPPPLACSGERPYEEDASFERKSIYPLGKWVAGTGIRRRDAASSSRRNPETNRQEEEEEPELSFPCFFLARRFVPRPPRRGGGRNEKRGRFGINRGGEGDEQICAAAPSGFRDGEVGILLLVLVIGYARAIERAVSSGNRIRNLVGSPRI